MRFLKALLRRGNPNRKLEGMMLALSRDFTDDSLAAFYKELRSAKLRVPASPLPGRPMPAGAEPIPAGFLAGRDPDGRRGLLAFTGEEALLAWHGYGIDTLEMAMPELCTKALESGMESVIINPCGPSGALIRQEAMGELVSGTTLAKRQAVPHGTSVTVGPPRVAPSTAVMAVLRAEAAKFPQIRATYIVDGAVGEEAARAMAAVVLDDGTAPDSVIPRFIEEATGQVGKAKMPDVLTLDETDPLTKLVREQGFEIYLRAFKKT
ncbi:MAG: SseB family protein [Elusimicrobiota bacterium]